jgi:hypothetical protein
MIAILTKVGRRRRNLVIQSLGISKEIAEAIKELREGVKQVINNLGGIFHPNAPFHQNY